MGMDGKEPSKRSKEKGQGRRFFFRPSPAGRDRRFSPSPFFHSLSPTFFFSLSLPFSSLGLVVLFSLPSQNQKLKQKNSATNAKHVFYLSAEFLMGRSLTNAVGNLGLEDAYGEAVKVRRREFFFLFFEREENKTRALFARQKTANSFPPSPFFSTHSNANKQSFGYDFEAVVDAEQNAALGNGGERSCFF